MNITSVKTATVQYSLSLPEIGRDYFIPDQKTIENEYISTSTSPAGIFRQIVKYDITSITRKYRVVLDQTRATTLEAMIQSDQTEFYLHVPGAIYRAHFSAGLEPFGPKNAVANINIAMIERVS